MSTTQPRPPGPDHPITVSGHPARVVVSVGDHIVADSTDALELREAGHSPVLYLPLHDLDRSVLTESETTSYCPYKGEANYFSITTPDGVLPDAVWYYKTPYDAVGEISGHAAFYPDRVQIDAGRSS